MGASSNTSRPRVVIVGAGFGGLNAALRLRKAPVDVLLIDRQNDHTFQPLLYPVASAGLEPEEIAHAVRGVFQKQRNFAFRLGEVTDVDLDAKQVEMATGEAVRFDFLILATGATTAFFGVDGASEHSFALKSLQDAIKLRSHIIRCFEAADRDPHAIDSGVLNFVVVGGGPTGVETAGALVELFGLVLKKDFSSLPVDRARVILIELQSELLNSFHPRSRAYALKTLKKRNVEVLLEKGVTRVAGDRVV
ncbi:MAG: FAD-dependent oxidoreductase, partial [Rhodothermales bacterium]|nr:FAD-dependent oxidoreductase [Rhodothermales bacterium]